MNTKTASSKTDYRDSVLQEGTKSRFRFTFAPNKSLINNLNGLTYQLRNFSRIATKLKYQGHSQSVEEVYKSLQRRRKELIDQLHKTKWQPRDRDFWILPGPPPFGQKLGEGGVQKSGGRPKKLSARYGMPSILDQYPEYAEKVVMSWRDRYCHAIEGFKPTYAVGPEEFTRSINHNSWAESSMYLGPPI